MSAAQLIALLMALVESLQRSLLSGVLDANTPIELGHLGQDYKDAVDEMRKAMEP